MKAQTLKLITLLALTAVISALITCFFCKKKDEDDDGGTRSGTSICMDYQNVPPATLTTKMVKSMVTQYSGAQLNSIQNDTAIGVPQDARAIWFDLETLKQFMYQIEHNAENNSTESRDKKLGVRIYYAAYPENTRMRDLALSQTDPNFSYNPAYEKHHTLVMIPTISGADGENYDFNPLDVSTYNGYVKMAKTENYYQNDNYIGLSLGTSSNPIISNTSSTNQTNANNGVSARNHGTLFPPNSTVGFSFIN